MVHSSSKAGCLPTWKMYIFTLRLIIPRPVMSYLWPSEAILLIRGHLLCKQGKDTQTRWSHCRSSVSGWASRDRKLSHSGLRALPQLSLWTTSSCITASLCSCSQRPASRQGSRALLPHLQLAHGSGWTWHWLAPRCVTFPCPMPSHPTSLYSLLFNFPIEIMDWLAVS